MESAPWPHCHALIYPFTDYELYELLVELLAVVAGAFLLRWLVQRLSRSRPGLAIGKAIAAAFVIRVLAAMGLDQTPVAAELRGGDESLFLENAAALADGDIGSDKSLDALTSEFHTFLFSLDMRVFDPLPDLAVRVHVIIAAVAGLAFLAAAVHELAGPRWALLVAWLLALEPTGIFFSGILHKEPLMFLAEGMVAFGGAKLWKSGDKSALVPLVLGCLIATATRPYVGWFLAAAAAMVALHASLRRNSPSGSLALATLVVALMVAFVPTVWNASSEESLEQLQVSQDANAADDDANLALEQVNYSTREEIVLNLPKRVSDVVLRPYPWQLENTSQQLGLIGTTVMFTGLTLLFFTLMQTGTVVLRHAAPLLYPAMMLLVAYSLSAGNAGTAFRYRTHVVAFIVALLVVLHAQRVERRAAATEGAATAPRPDWTVQHAA